MTTGAGGTWVFTRLSVQLPEHGGDTVVKEVWQGVAAPPDQALHHTLQLLPSEAVRVVCTHKDTESQLRLWKQALEKKVNESCKKEIHLKAKMSLNRKFLNRKTQIYNISKWDGKWNN